MKNPTKGLPLAVAVACGLVPEYPQPWWKRWKNRLAVWLLPEARWPRIEIHPPQENEWAPDHFLVPLYEETEAKAWAKALSLQDKCAASYNSVGADAGFMPPFSVIMEQIGSPLQFGPMQVCQGSYKGRFCIGREDKDQWRFWTGAASNLFVPKTSTISIWECSGREPAEMWLARLKDGSIHEFSDTDHAKSPMSELPEASNGKPGKAETDQGQESV